MILEALGYAMFAFCALGALTTLGLIVLLIADLWRTRHDHRALPHGAEHRAVVYELYPSCERRVHRRPGDAA